MNENIHIDENGDRWLTNDNGELLKDESGNYIPPTQSVRNSKEGEFTTYDTSQGHCALCGSLRCRGECFR